METIFIPILAFLVLASGLATAKEPVCYDSKGNVVNCNTTVKSGKSNSSERVQKPAPAPAPAGLAIDNGRNNPDSRVKQTAPAPAPIPAPVGGTTIKCPGLGASGDPLKGLNTGGSSSGNAGCTAQRDAAASAGDGQKQPAPKPAPVVEKPPVKPPVVAPTPATPTPPATMKGDFSRGNSPDRVKEPVPPPAVKSKSSKNKTAPYRDPEDMTH